MVDINISLVGANGDTILMDDETYILESGLRGFGIPSTLLRIDASAGDGGVFRNSKRDVREIDFPVMVLGADRAAVEGNLRRLARVLAAETRLVATYATGEQYELLVHYAGGGETDFGDDAGATYCRWVLTLRSPQPYWTAVESSSFSIAGSTTTKGLLKATSGINSLTRLQVNTSQALGSVTIENAGDVAAPVVWSLKGPADSVSITVDGVGFTYDEVIDSLTTISIDTAAGTVVDQTGANKYAALAAAPKLVGIPAGVTVVSITATGATADTRISGFFKPRYEVIH